MAVQYQDIQELLRSRADLHVRLNLMPYDGTPEIKERGDGKYLYVRKRVAGKQTSTYVGVYTEELYNLLLRNAREAREIRKELRGIEKQLAAAGYSEDELSSDVINNIAFARANMKMNIYDQAVLEGVATSFPQTEEIIENGKVSGMTATDVQKILNLNTHGSLSSTVMWLPAFPTTICSVTLQGLLMKVSLPRVAVFVACQSRLVVHPMFRRCLLSWK